MASIFEIENRLDIPKEFSKLINIFHENSQATIYEVGYNTSKYGTFMDAINKKIFLQWEYRDTFLDAYEFLEHLGIDIDNIEYLKCCIEGKQFLYYLEFILIWYY